MDFVNSLTGKKEQQPQGQQQQQSTGGIMGKFNNMAGGGAKGEQNEDALDKGVDFVQEKFLGQGAQNNENAAEQAKDEAISDTIRSQYRNITGKDIPIADKDRKFG